MGLVERHIRGAAFTDYRLLKNYALYREECYDENNKLVKILFDEEMREKYISVYENKLGIDIHPAPRDAQKIVEEKLEDAIFMSTRLDGIVFYLIYASNVIELGMTVKAYQDNNPKLRTISYVNEDKITKTFMDGQIAADKYTNIMLKEQVTIKKMLNLPTSKSKLELIKPVHYPGSNYNMS